MTQESSVFIHSAVDLINVFYIENAEKTFLTGFEQYLHETLSLI